MEEEAMTRFGFDMTIEEFLRKMDEMSRPRKADGYRAGRQAGDGIVDGLVSNRGSLFHITGKMTFDESAVEIARMIGENMSTDDLTTTTTDAQETTMETTVLNAIPEIDPATLDPNDEEHEDATRLTALYTATVSSSLTSSDGDEYYDELVETVRDIPGVYDGWNNEVEVTLSTIIDRLDVHIDTYDMEAIHDESDEIEGGEQYITNIRWESSDSLYDNVCESRIYLTTSVEASVQEPPKRVFLHELDEPCTCPSCEAKKPFENMEREARQFLSELEYNKDMYPMVSRGPFITYRGMIAITVADSEDRFDVGTVMFSDGLKKVVSLDLGKITTAMHVYDTSPKPEEVAATGTNISVNVVRDMLVKVARDMFFTVKDVDPDDEEQDQSLIFSTQPMTFYKITNRDGQAQNGGNYQYSLPTKLERTDDMGSFMPDQWEPGEWSEPVNNLRLCSIGYHITPKPIRWMQSLDDRIFTVNTRGISSDMSFDKAVCKSVQMATETRNITGSPKLTTALRVWDDLIVPALVSFKDHMEAGTTGEPPKGTARTNRIDNTVRLSTMGSDTGMDRADNNESERDIIDLAMRSVVNRATTGDYWVKQSSLNAAVGFVMAQYVAKYYGNTEQADVVLEAIKNGYVPALTDDPFPQLAVVPVASSHEEIED